jgi:protoporphyrin/coproporphyrin ferrochelatase
MTKKKLGLLVMAYGTPYTEEDIEPYYTHIRHGRRPADEHLQDLKNRYAAIGGISPLAEITNSQAKKLTEKLNEIQDEYEFELFIGLKHIHPFIEDAVEDMSKAGIQEAISIVLAPHYSTFSIKSYNERAQKTADQYGIQISSVDHWYDEPKFIDYWVKQIHTVFEHMPEDDQKNACVIFSAHSLPEKILQHGDPYAEQLSETARLIAEKAGIKEYAIGWQSEGQTPDPWLGPDVQDLTRELHKEKGYKAFVYCPVGFVADHLEVLYDNDVECRIVCEEIGANYYRPEMPNDHAEFIEALCEVVLKKLN